MTFLVDSRCNSSTQTSKSKGTKWGILYMEYTPALKASFNVLINQFLPALGAHNEEILAMFCLVFKIGLCPSCRVFWVHKRKNRKKKKLTLNETSGHAVHKQKNSNIGERSFSQS